MPALAAFCVFCAVLTGCSRATVTTSVKGTGAWTRSIAFHGPPKAKNGFQITTKLEDVFVLPTGAPWTTSNTADDKETVYKAERLLLAGETIEHDVTIKGPASKPLPPQFVNEVTVRKIGAGQIEYRETLRWKGPPPKDFEFGSPESNKMIKSALPAQLATDANARIAAKTMMRHFARFMLGPKEVGIGQLMTDLMLFPDAAERRLKRKLGKEINQGLKEEFGDKMTDAERSQTVTKLIETAMAAMQKTQQSKTDLSAGPPGGKDDASGSMVGLTFITQMPGKVISSNGEVDEDTNEVVWTLLPEAAAFGDVVLTATAQLPAQANVYRAVHKIATATTRAR